jgi:aminopeptidase N
MVTALRRGLPVMLLALLAGCPASEQSPAAGERAAGAAAETAAAAGDPYRLTSAVRPLAQQLTLRIDPARPDYSGKTTMDIEILRPTRLVRLHAEDMQIDSVTLGQGEETVGVTSRQAEHGLLQLEAETELAPGRYTLAIGFTNDFNTDGVGIHRNELDGRHYIFSQFEAVDAREAFPCFDEPGFKIPWQLTISTPEDQLAITNTPEASAQTASGWTTTEFAATPPLPSYLIAVAVGPFETVPIPGMSVPGRVVVPEGRSALTKFAVETTPPLLAFLEEYFGEPYPFSKLDLIATVGAFSGAMEHPGAITYSDFFLLLDANASARQRQMLLRVTAHELAHQWFGNLVTMQWWDDLWLNESFADWMADKTVAAVYPDTDHGSAELRTLFRIMDADASPATEPIRRTFRATDNFEDGVFLAYFKGKAVLGMF